MRCATSPRYNSRMPRLPFALLIFLVFSAAARAAEPVFPPGSRVGLAPPPGMTVGTSFQGFEDRAQRVTRLGQNGVALRKWALLTRTEDLTVVVIGIVPEAAREAYPDGVMRAAFAGVIVRAKLTPEEMLAVL